MPLIIGIVIFHIINTINPPHREVDSGKDYYGNNDVAHLSSFKWKYAKIKIIVTVPNINAIAISNNLF